MMSVLTGCMTSPSANSGAITASVNGESLDTNANENINSDNMPKEASKHEAAKINAQLGMAYLEQKNVQRAKMKLLLALSQGPDMPEPWYSMGYFLEATGDKEEAEKYYRKALSVAPDRGDARNNYGTFLCRKGKYAESVKYFLSAAKTPNYLDPAAAYENAGLCSMKMSAYNQSISYFKQALLKDPGRNLSLLKLAEANVKLGNFQAAKSFMIQYSLVAPASPESEQLYNVIKHKTG